MAKAIIQDAEGVKHTYDDIENLSMTAPYWIVQRTKDVREFIHFDLVRHLRVEGEEELIQSARAKLAAQQSQDLGVEA